MQICEQIVTKTGGGAISSIFFGVRARAREGLHAGVRAENPQRRRKGSPFFPSETSLFPPIRAKIGTVAQKTERKQAEISTPARATIF
ncbi:MAG: hypothetical protein J6Z13_03875 [Clostridia bacterium]|nr:hypothetical protein [Clostridia bacterium]